MENDDIAVQVKDVSKIYRLWTSPSARLMHPVKNLINSFLPRILSKRWNKNTTTDYHEFYALNDVSFKIRKGESWGFIGVNGSGKSTLLKMISGNLRPSAGTIEVDGKVVILDYGSGLNGEFTGEENIYMKAALLGLTKKQIDERFDSIVAFAELGEFIKQPTKTYSSGMTARLGFAIMSHVDADIMITDEALAVGDVFFVQKCMSYIRTFLKSGTFLFVSHSTNDVLSLCQKAVWLENGQVKAIGAAKDVTEAYLTSHVVANSQKLMADNQTLSDEKTAEPVHGPEPELANNVSEIKITQPRLSTLMKSKIPRVIKDPRLEFLNRSPWRNDIKVPEFSLDSAGFGVGGAKIENVAFEDEQGETLSWIIGAEMVCLTITVRAEMDLTSPIVGFQVKDRLGQVLFADTTFFASVENPFLVENNQNWEAKFSFQMPLLPPGDYAIRVAVAIGAEEGSSAILHSIDNALIFRSVASEPRHGLIGIPMQSIGIQVFCYE